jgi:hypothetical protein
LSFRSDRTQLLLTQRWLGSMLANLDASDLQDVLRVSWVRVEMQKLQPEMFTYAALENRILIHELPDGTQPVFLWERDAVRSVAVGGGRRFHRRVIAARGAFSRSTRTKAQVVCRRRVWFDIDLHDFLERNISPGLLRIAGNSCCPELR